LQFYWERNSHTPETPKIPECKNNPGDIPTEVTVVIQGSKCKTGKQYMSSNCETIEVDAIVYVYKVNVTTDDSLVNMAKCIVGELPCRACYIAFAGAAEAGGWAKSSMCLKVKHPLAIVLCAMVVSATFKADVEKECGDICRGVAIDFCCFTEVSIESKFTEIRDEKRIACRM
jgi:hypothetical protein